MAKQRPWTREELLLAMNLYCRLPFGKMHKGNPEIVALAQAIGRTASSVAMKLGNLASLDPAERARGIAGLSKASAADRAIWDDFHANWEACAVASQQLYDSRVAPPIPTRSVSEDQPKAPARDAARTKPPPSIPSDDQIALRGAADTETERSVKVRIGQSFFRRAVFASYGSQCCISGIGLGELLIASHILPWDEFPQHRVNPRNGLCLSRLHDAAFDRGLITFDGDCRLILSRRLKDHVTNATLKTAFLALEGEPLRLPEKFRPEEAFLEGHRERVFA